MYKLTSFGVRRLSDGASIPPDDGNRDWLDYQSWLVNGNTPDPADPGPNPAREQIDVLERQHLAPRFLREYLLADIEQRAAAADQNPMQLPAYVKLKALDTQIAALRSQL